MLCIPTGRRNILQLHHQYGIPQNILSFSDCEPLSPQDPNEAQPGPSASPVMDPNEARATPRVPPVADPNGNDEWDPYASKRRLGEPAALGVLAPAGDPLAPPHRNMYINNTSERSDHSKGTSLHDIDGNHALLVVHS